MVRPLSTVLDPFVGLLWSNKDLGKHLGIWGIALGEGGACLAISPDETMPNEAWSRKRFLLTRKVNHVVDLPRYIVAPYDCTLGSGLALSAQPIRAKVYAWS